MLLGWLMAIVVSFGGAAEASPDERPYEPRGSAIEVFYARNAEQLVSGPAGTGKSRALLEVLNLRASKYPGSRHLIVRKTRTSLNESGLVTFEEKVLPPHSPVKKGPKRRYRVVYEYPNGSEIVVAGMDDPTRIMSTEFDTVFAQEATEFKEEDWDNLTTRLRNGVLPYQVLTADCNPGSPRHWLKKRCEAGKCRLFESRHEDNPLLWDGRRWTEYGAAYLAKLDNLAGVRYLRLRKGLWVMAEGMVYTDYDPAIHLIDRFDIPASWPRFWVVDFGFTNAFCWQAWAQDPDGRLYRYREIYQTKRLVEDHAIVIARATAGEPTPMAVICDHDAEDRATLEKHLKMGTIAAYKSISDGLQAVAARLRKAEDGRARLFLLRDSLVERDSDLSEAKKPTCTEEEFESYVWAENAAGVKEVPVDRDNHGMDTMRYLVAHVDLKSSPGVFI